MRHLPFAVIAAIFGFSASAAMAGGVVPESSTPPTVTVEAPAGTSALATSEHSSTPAIDVLTIDSDFTVFMRPGVPHLVRSMALRKLWRLDPAFSRRDVVDADEFYISE